MKIINGKIIPDYHPQVIVNILSLLERVQTQGIAEAKEFSRCADFLQALSDGHYSIVSATGEAEKASPAEAE